MAKTHDILLAMCPPYGPEMPPLSLASLAAAARHKGFDVLVRDYNIRVRNAAGKDNFDEWDMDMKATWVWPSKIRETYERYKDILDACVDDLAAADTGAYGFSVHSDNRLMTQEIIRRLKAKRPDAFVLVGGMGVYSETSMKIFEQDLVDAFVMGPEGESTFVDFLAARLDGKPLDEVPGVRVRKDGAYTPIIERKAVDNLDVFPGPNSRTSTFRSTPRPICPSSPAAAAKATASSATTACSWVRNATAPPKISSRKSSTTSRNKASATFRSTISSSTTTSTRSTASVTWCASGARKSAGTPTPSSPNRSSSPS
ncbi:MAG: cobalamin-dependent protein [Deltaproteobacteria bacterium]|nr:cobalamin-dependent protein [Deltaproteobacteria bacterium]